MLKSSQLIFGFRAPSRWLMSIVFVVILSQGVLAEEKSGEEIYKAMCARCHGLMGEGTKKCEDPLVGDRSIPQLSKYIAKRMPEDDPGSCVGPDADKVAAYIFDAFYSPAAQARIKPPRIELARLTVKQYRNAIADLVGNFREAGKWTDQRGLKGEYFNSRQFRRNQPVLERIDPLIDFDWKTKSPQEGKVDEMEFSGRWNGSVYAPDTGMYEFVVRTDQAARLWVNDLNKALIDAWVKSGKDTEFRGSIYLIGGRAYPLRLEFSKAKQGVDDSKKNPTKVSRPAMLHLEWKRPEGNIEVIPSRNLLPNIFPNLFVVETPFPPDDRSVGWERGTTVSKEWDQATTDGAIETAGYIVSRIEELASVRKGASNQDAKFKEFTTKFAERAFRRPLADEEKQLYIEKQFQAVKDPELALRRVLLLILKSPRFLYREVGNSSDDYDVASRLSFELWDSIPDQTLLEEAAKGKLKTKEEVTKQVERMLSDSRTRAKLRGFLLQWLKADQVADIAKDPKRFPGFDKAVISDLRTSLDLFLDDVAWGSSSDFRQFFLSNELYLNGRLAKYYGVDVPLTTPFQKVKTKANSQRSGVLTHPYLMARFAYTGTTSPIHRGVFLARGVLGVALKPPQDAFTPLAEDLHPGLTTRERVILQTKGDNCQTCHSIINSLGFTLEKFDAVGRYREKENNKPIDSSGSYQTRKGDTVKFADVSDLAKFLANSEEVHQSFVDQLFHHLVQQPIRAYGDPIASELRTSFSKNNYSIRKLISEIVVASAFKERDNKIKPSPP